MLMGMILFWIGRMKKIYCEAPEKNEQVAHRGPQRWSRLLFIAKLRPLLLNIKCLSI